MQEEETSLSHQAYLFCVDAVCEPDAWGCSSYFVTMWGPHGPHVADDRAEGWKPGSLMTPLTVPISLESPTSALLVKETPILRDEVTFI